MNLTKEHWTEKDIKPFQDYLKTLSKGEEKSYWEQRIINTQLPCLAVPSTEVKRIVKEIYKGNYLEFLNLWLWDNWTNTSINGNLISKIKDFDTIKKYLDIYANKCDNWATSDVLKFSIKENNKPQFFQLCQTYTKSQKPFVRRIGLVTLLKFADDNNYIDKILNISNSLYNEQEYYVNMANAWLIAECFTKQREKTLLFLQNHHLNKFTINKAISKCRDSFRISSEDKEMLLKYRIKN